MKRILAPASLALVLAACGDTTVDNTPDAPPPPAESAEATQGADADSPPEVTGYTVETAMQGTWRTQDERARDKHRHPAETIEFFGIEGDDTVIEIWPGGGWYTNILAPWLHANGGQFIAAWVTPSSSERAASSLDSFKANYAEYPDTFGEIEYTYYDAESGPLGDPGSVDAVLTFRNVHNWMGGDHADKFFVDAYDVLKPGGVLGVVEHRLPSAMEQDPSAPSGYVHEDYVTALAEAAGFELEASSEINANPADTADHPFGVWTLPPVSRTADREGNTPDDFDPAPYTGIGESDRMTLKFVKPAAE